MIQFTHKRQSVPRVLAPVALALALSGCSTLMLPYTSANAPVDIQASASLTPTYYLQQAENTGGQASINWNLLALKAFVVHQQWPQAVKQSQFLAKERLTPEQQIQWQLNSAMAYKNQHQAQHALSLLQFPTWWPVTPKQYQDYYRLKSQLFVILKRPLEAAKAQTQLSTYLPSEDRLQNWRDLWHLLAPLSSAQLQSMALPSDDTVLRGWLQLALIKNAFSTQPEKFQQALKDWLNTHPYHPAQHALPPELDHILQSQFTTPEHIALLLPLSGRYAKQGEAVRDGFLTAMMQDPERDPDLILNVYDTQAESMSTLVQKLQQNSPDLIIGPLQKEKIIELQQLDNNAWPMLALNTPSQTQDQQACYFSLSPEQSAQQMAQYLYDKGLKSPLVLYSNNGSGQRMMAAFEAKWQALTEQPSAQAPLPNTTQYQTFAKKWFANQSDKFDAVYMIASANDVALLRPSIEVQIDPKLQPPKFFADGRIYQTKNQNTSDLVGITFNDMPLLINQHLPKWQHVEKNWPNLNNQSLRLHAFGADAYHLAQDMTPLKHDPNAVLHGETGELRLSQQCIVNRQLSWATFTSNGIKPAQ